MILVLSGETVCIRISRLAISSTRVKFRRILFEYHHREELLPSFKQLVAINEQPTVNVNGQTKELLSFSTNSSVMGHTVLVWLLFTIASALSFRTVTNDRFMTHYGIPLKVFLNSIAQVHRTQWEYEPSVSYARFLIPSYDLDLMKSLWDLVNSLFSVI